MDELRRHIEKIVSLTEDEFIAVKSFFTEKQFKKHRFLIQEGGNATNEFFILKGLVKLYYTNAEGKDHILQFAAEDWWVTDYNAFFNQAAATLNLDCLEDTTVLSISFDGRERLCAEFPKMQYFFLKKSNSGYVALQRRILSLLDGTAAERYAQFRLLYPGLVNRVPKTLLAAYLGVSRETLSRLA
ncbi:Crp/Fnr family transcriptional regulator [Flavobacterium cyanobacteriorum]|uniref:Crp/Fnr family transcriptional regulator n=1 Tax=Flavobacterium cyanobacteriorum TaxID=2022802 RepID=A0A255YRY9_9FLAO|nr:Crp/Fnr family transcriptional regulator [Flavobacterium cyanobacteriorum]OYQ31957.1 Crp/Fnr family transcriptional regulator [Flavobacterium cyanobacteriorum]